MEYILGLQIGFLPIRAWDVLDILIVGYLIYRIYRLLRGNIAFNILIGVLILYIVYWLVSQLEMDLLSGILRQFVQVGVLALVIIFQPELRRFLVFLGNTTLRRRSQLLNRLMDRGEIAVAKKSEKTQALKAALMRMSRRKIGALIILSKAANLEGLIRSGVILDAQISQQLIESIFCKTSPLHDGAVIIQQGKIFQASGILPVSENERLPSSAGLRHRAAVGITEKADVLALIVSEESGGISYAYHGQIFLKIGEDTLDKLLNEHLQ